ncbi:MAG: four helix bundle protein [Patescibacteria group bacterium]|nr:four helix bundle protein [Patescibacteria group bacterium]
MRFEDIRAWQKAEELTLEVYKNFRGLKDFGFKDQIQRAAVSVMNNIAEGYERKSQKSFVHFLLIANGSCAEVRSMLYLAFKLDYLNKDQFDRLLVLAVETSSLIIGLEKFIRKELKENESIDK